MSTALQVITDAMSKAGIIESGDVLTAEEANDGLRALNDLLENLSLEPQSVFERQTETFATIANQATYTIGPAGDWSTTRPVRIADVGFCRYQSVDYPMVAVDKDSYALLALKAQPGVIVENFLYLNDNPLGRIALWPVPSQVVTIGINTDRVLTTIPTLVTQLAFPVGYELMLKCLLAELLAPEYGVGLPAAVVEQARKFKADIKRANRRQRVSRFDDVPGVHGFYDWRLGV